MNIKKITYTHVTYTRINISIDIYEYLSNQYQNIITHTLALTF